MGVRIVLRLLAVGTAAFVSLPTKAAEITCAQAVAADDYVVEYFRSR